MAAALTSLTSVVLTCNLLALASVPIFSSNTLVNTQCSDGSTVIRNAVAVKPTQTCARLCSVSSYHNNMAESDLSYLISFYFSTNGNSWSLTQNNWLDGRTPPCSWRGISCTTTPNSRVQSIRTLNFNSFGLSGTLPSPSTSPSSLYGLETWDINQNIALTGNLPDISSLPVIQILRITFTNINGGIPNLSIMKSPNFYYYEVSNNALTGALPAFPRTLSIFYANNNGLTGGLPNWLLYPQLQQFQVANNKLTGSVPPFDGPETLSLSFLIISSNFLSGIIPSIRNTRISRLDASHNAFTSIVRLSTSISELDLSWNRLKQLPSLPGVIEEVYLEGNEIGGILPSFEAYSNLRTLNLSRNLLQGVIPSLDYTSLELLDLGDNFFSGPFPSLPSQVQNIVLRNNVLSGSLPDWTQFKQLRYVDISNNGFSGQYRTFPSSISGVNLSHNALSGSIAIIKITSAGENPRSAPHHVMSAGGQQHQTDDDRIIMEVESAISHENIPYTSISTTLSKRRIRTLRSDDTPVSDRVLDLSYNELSDIFPSLVDNNEWLEIYAHHNKFTTLPNVYSSGNLNSYPTILDFSYNRLNINLTSTMFPSRCKILKLNNNQMISSNLPNFYILDIPGVQSWQYNFRYIDISANLLSGLVDPFSTLGLSNDLLEFHADYNLLTGSVPNLRTETMRHFTLSHNQLTGSIPLLPKSLAKLDVSYNFLSSLNFTINSTSYPSLQSVNLSCNKLTGVMVATIAGPNITIEATCIDTRDTCTICSQNTPPTETPTTKPTRVVPTLPPNTIPGCPTFPATPTTTTMPTSTPTISINDTTSTTSPPTTSRQGANSASHVVMNIMCMMLTWIVTLVIKF